MLWRAKQTLREFVELEEFLIGEKIGFQVSGMILHIPS